MNELVELLQEARLREIEQALFYRFLAADAELAGDAGTAERLNELLADEQHHVSRLTARILELGGKPGDPGTQETTSPALDAWEAEARTREESEVRWYEEALRRIEDPETTGVIRGILDSERHHRNELAGKWMPAGPRGPEEDT
jgi:rubrerythrin